MRGFGIFAFVLVFALAVGMAAAVEPTVTYTVVHGYITNSGTGSPVDGATVVATCDANSNSFTTISGTNGFYTNYLVCPVGSLVHVTANKTGASATNSSTVMYVGSVPGTAIDLGLAIVDIELPEFPSVVVPAILSVVSFGLVRFRKKN